MRQHVPTRKFHSRVADMDNEIATWKTKSTRIRKKKINSTSLKFKLFFTSLHKKLHLTNIENLRIRK